GLGLRDSLDESNGGLTKEEEEEIGAIIAERAEAKKARDFAKADALRQGLKERGIILEDGPNGTTWRSVNCNKRG
ncbi:MAG: cysteine--tRNA ligase, partial [Treponema sp.]|nr:cysteine--tRNA ligase [Treponema sp.]